MNPRLGDDLRCPTHHMAQPSVDILGIRYKSDTYMPVSYTGDPVSEPCHIRMHARPSYPPLANHCVKYGSSEPHGNKKDNLPPPSSPWGGFIEQLPITDSHSTVGGGVCAIVAGNVLPGYGNSFFPSNL